MAIFSFLTYLDSTCKRTNSKGRIKRQAAVVLASDTDQSEWSPYVNLHTAYPRAKIPIQDNTLKNNDDHPVFISIETMAFSGATLLTLLLNTHPSITTVGEMSGLIARDDPDEYMCSCGQRIRSCGFWQAVTDTMTEKGHPFDIAHFNTKFDFGGSHLIKYARKGSFRSHYLSSVRDKIMFSIPTERERHIAMVQRNVAFIETVLEITGKKYFLDSSKSRVRVKALRRFSDLDIRIIHLVRRAEGVVYSQLRRNRGARVETSAREWARQHRMFNAAFSSWSKKKYLMIRYEDLCQDTEETLSKIFDFLSLDPKAVYTETADAHIIGNSMRLRPLTDITLDERWKQQLPSSHLNKINRIAGKLLRKYGYLS